MKFTGSLLKEDIKGTETTFAVVVVNQKVIGNRDEASKTAFNFQTIFPGVPIVLMAQDHNGTPVYVGRPDLVWFLADVPLRRIPWKEYTFKG
ncbi:MAG: hypothetical protein ACE5FN_09270 [Leptospirillia bacterium]